MNITEKELKIVEIILSDEVIFGKNKVVICLFLTDRDIRINKVGGEQIYFKNEPNLLDTSRKDTERPIRELFCEILLQYASEGKIYSDVEFEINPDGSYTSRYWFDEDRLYKQEYDYAMLSAKDFPHAAATNLVNYHFFEIKFKRKFTHIHWTMEVKNGEAFFEVYSINQRNQILPVELQETGVMFDIGDEMVYFEKFWKYKLLEHYEVTNNGILKDVWQPWNKIVISIPPDGYLNENEDIEYYLDDVKLDKDFFLIGR